MGEERDLLYHELLKRIYDQMEEDKVGVSQISQKSKLPVPKLNGMGPKKVMWENFSEICLKMNRQTDHVSSYFFTELGTQGSFDGNNRLIICGRFRPKHIESVLKKYIDEYVTCSMCKRTNTTLERDPSIRIYFMTCFSCGSKRSVNPIESGFHVETKADRTEKKSTKSYT